MAKLRLVVAEVVVVAVLFVGCANAQSELDAVTIARIDEVVDTRVDWPDPSPAYAILVDKDGEAIYERYLGFADISNSILAGRDTVFRIGSITKSYTALAILQLVERGLVDLDAEVSRYLPDFDGPGGGTTIEQLLTHTSGIPNYTAIPEAAPILSWRITTRNEVLELFRDKPLEFEPGAIFNYSNSGYYLLGLVIEAVTHQSYFEYLQSSVFEPFGLDATYSGELKNIVEHQARGYIVTGDSIINAPPTPSLTPFSAGTLEASASDLVKFRRAVRHSSASSRVLRDLVTKCLYFPGGERHQYSLGALNITKLADHDRWGHGGGIAGFSSHHDYYPDEDLTIVVLSNANGGPVTPSSLATKIAREIFEIASPNIGRAELSSEELQFFTGSYHMQPLRLGSEYEHFEVRDGVLNIRIDMGEASSYWPLVPISKTEFYVASDDEERVSFTLDSDTTSVVITTPAGRYFGVREEDASN